LPSRRTEAFAVPKDWRVCCPEGLESLPSRRTECLPSRRTEKLRLDLRVGWAKGCPLASEKLGSRGMVFISHFPLNLLVLPIAFLACPLNWSASRDGPCAPLSPLHRGSFLRHPFAFWQETAAALKSADIDVEVLRGLAIAGLFPGANLPLFLLPQSHEP